MSQGPRLSGIVKGYGGTTVLDDISLDVRRGELLSLVGASGCGKSTLLRIIAGLEHADRGNVFIGGRDVTDLDPQRRDVAMVFQSYALYPHMTAGDNIATPLRMSRLNALARWPLIGWLAPGRRAALDDIGGEVRAVAAQLRIERLLERKPAQLSGGQRQRVALARAMVRRPVVFLMDEPLSNLDAKLRVHMRAELTELHTRLGATFVYVTHDQVEAMTMSDRIALMAGGRILQLGTPAELYHEPATLQVAQFIGSPAINCLPADGGGGGVRCFGRPIDGLASPGTVPVSLAVRPESLRLCGEPGDAAFRARVRRLEYHGADCFLFATPIEAPEIAIHARLTTGEAARLSPDDTVDLHFPPNAVHLFDGRGDRIVAAERAVAAVPRLKVSA